MSLIVCLYKAELAEVGKPGSVSELDRSGVSGSKQASTGASTFRNNSCSWYYIPIKAVRRASEWGKREALSACE